jgi:hypothetical protein
VNRKKTYAITSLILLLAILLAAFIAIRLVSNTDTHNPVAPIVLAPTPPVTRPATAPSVGGEYFITGNADRTGPYTLRATDRHLSLREALVAAGLSAVDPQKATVLVIHRGTVQQQSKNEYSLNDILELRIPPVDVLANDMIIVH